MGRCKGLVPSLQLGTTEKGHLCSRAPYRLLLLELHHRSAALCQMLLLSPPLQVLISRVQPKKRLHVNFSESGSQVTQPGTLRPPIFLPLSLLPSFYCPFSLRPFHFSYPSSLLPLPHLPQTMKSFTPASLWASASFSSLFLDQLLLLFWYMDPHESSKVVSSAPQSPSLWLMLLASHPEALYEADAPILQLLWVSVNNRSHLYPSLEDCP